MVMNKADVCNTGVCRPGGFTITDRALEFCSFKKGAKLLDVGCGLGATVRRGTDEYGLDVYGIEKDKEVLALAKARAYPQSDRLRFGDAVHMPFGDREMDGMLFECSLSKMKNPDAVLHEAYRILKPGGYLIISDLYARGEPAQLCGLLGRVASREDLCRELESSHFSVELFEDYSGLLRATWGQMVLEYGLDALYANLKTDCCKMRAVKCGYCLIIAKKECI
ncbi:MAG TPA: methyltransferase domain-containing protein [Clostridia bacterium]|jgi:arsenite methyltransferase|nr:methyltransferase domain-containing protein [Clostridiales bacterium]HZX46411.1 methyltransferase domain-containing protein [Clostridia bacterium]